MNTRMIMIVSVGGHSHVCIIFELTIWMQSYWDQLHNPLDWKGSVFNCFITAHYQVPQGNMFILCTVFIVLFLFFFNSLKSSLGN